MKDLLKLVAGFTFIVTAGIATANPEDSPEAKCYGSDSCGCECMRDSSCTCPIQDNPCTVVPN